MAIEATDRPVGLNEFFAVSEARVDRWRTLNRVARTLAGTGPSPVGGVRHDPKELLAELTPLEEQAGDWSGFARLVQRISNALLSNSRRSAAPCRTLPATSRSPPGARPGALMREKVGGGQGIATLAERATGRGRGYAICR